MEHAPICTVEEHKTALTEFKFTGLFLKNLFLKGKKSGNFYLITALPETKIDLNALAKKYKEGNSGLRNAPSESLVELLNCIRGCVSPLGLLNDTNKIVTFLIDQNLSMESNLLVHPLQNDLTLEMKAVDLFKLIDRTYEIVDFEHIEVNDEKDDTKDVKGKKDNKEKEKKGKDNKKKEEVVENNEDNELIGITIKREDNFPEW